MLSRLILASVILLGASAPAVAQDRMAPNAQLFWATNFMGRGLTITREAENFCRSMGYVSARNSAAETIRGRIYLADVLCSRWN